MAFINWVSYRLFGGIDDSSGRHVASPPTQTQLEALVVGVTARKFKGPKRNGHYSIHFRNGTAAGATSAMTVWYSNLPDPDVTDDTQWVLDTNITPVDLTIASTSQFITAGNVYPEWVRIKCSIVTSAGSGVYAFIRSEGNQDS